MRTSLLLLTLAPFAFTSALRAEDDDAAAKTQLAAEVAELTSKLAGADSVTQGTLLDQIADHGSELRDLPVEKFAERIRKCGGDALDRFVAVLAGEILAIVDPEGTVDWVEHTLRNRTSPLERQMAFAMLSEIRSERAAKLAEPYARAGSLQTRIAALTALAKIRQPCALDTLISALSSPEKEIKDNAAIALGRLGDERAIPALVARLDDGDGDHPMFAAWALEQIPDRTKAFGAVTSRLRKSSGHSGDAKARVIAGLSGPKHVETLRGLLRGGDDKWAYAAAIALGRLCKDDLESQKMLLERLIGSRDERLRFACFFGLSRNASKELGPEIVPALKRNASGKSAIKNRTFRCLAFLCGDLGLEDAGPILHRVARSHSNELTWRVAAVNFWKCAGPEERRALKDSFNGASDKKVVVRLAEVLGRSHRVEEFKFLTEQLRRFGPGDEQFAVEIGLEHMTGHFFGPYFGIWKKWLEQNPDFFEPKVYRIDRRKWAKAFSQKDREYRQTPETERAVQLGLAWLARHVTHDGSLDPNRFYDRCSHEPSCVKTGARHMLDPVGTTSLAALAFLGGGYSPEAGKFKDTTRRLLEYIEIRQGADGNYTSMDKFQGYNRPIAVYALAEAFNVTGDDRYGSYLRRGIDYMVEIQNELGSWHYQAKARVTDTSVTSWALLGLGVARKSGFAVRESIFEGCDMVMDAYADRVTKERENFIDLDPAYGYDVGKTFSAKYKTGYQNTTPENATAAFGLMSRLFLGYSRAHPFCIGSANFILTEKMESIPKGERWEKYVSKNRFPSYAWYYGTLAMHQMGGRFFRNWNAVIKRLLPAIQNQEGCDKGSWDVYNYDFVAGKVYTTAMGVLTLESYYRYKPFFEPPAEGDEGDDPDDGKGGTATPRDEKPDDSKPKEGEK